MNVVRDAPRHRRSPSFSGVRVRGQAGQAVASRALTLTPLAERPLWACDGRGIAARTLPERGVRCERAAKHRLGFSYLGQGLFATISGSIFLVVFELRASL
jgi:hypothetical protein